MAVLQASVVLTCLSIGASHFAMNKPPSWQDPDGKLGMGLMFRAAGCKGTREPGEKEFSRGCVSEWYTNNTFIPGKPTLADDSYLRTYKDFHFPWHGHEVNFPYNHNPWFAPGTAPVFGGGCGIDGGNPHGCPNGNPKDDGCAPGGYGHGPDGRSLPGNTKPTEWKAGDVVEVAWGIEANHGGGYQYRLCPYNKSVPKMVAITEECFQQTPLRFVGDSSWAQFREKESSRIEFKANRTSVGTMPAGSQWTKNPIPACAGPGGGSRSHEYLPWDGHCKGGYQFPPPAPGLFGFWGFDPLFQPRGQEFSIVDKVQVPSDLPAGDYVLSLRFDCEQTAQVWNSCSDIHISVNSSAVLV